jgi:hypothetical protein
MDQAAQAGNRTRTPALLAAITTAAIPGRPPAATPAGTTPDSIQLSTWEWEGGQDGARSQKAATSAPESPPAQVGGNIAQVSGSGLLPAAVAAQFPDRDSQPV